MQGLKSCMCVTFPPEVSFEWHFLPCCNEISYSIVLLTGSFVLLTLPNLKIFISWCTIDGYGHQLFDAMKATRKKKEALTRYLVRSSTYVWGYEFLSCNVPLMTVVIARRTWKTLMNICEYWLHRLNETYRTRQHGNTVRSTTQMKLLGETWQKDGTGGDVTIESVRKMS